MPALTSPRQYPYPLDGDPINVAGDIQKLAMKIDDDVTAVVATKVTDLSHKYDKAGGTISGNAAVTGTLHVTGVSTFDNATKVNDRFDVIADANEGIYLTNANNTPHLSMYDHANGELHGMIACAGGDMYIHGDNDLYFRANGELLMSLGLSTAVPALYIGKTAGSLDVVGFIIAAGGDIEGSARSTIGANTTNFYARRIGAAVVAGGIFAAFTTGTGSGAKTLGTVTQVGAAPGTGVAYNTTSDYRLKDELGPVEDPIGKLMALKPKHLRWKDEGSEFDGFIAHEVAEVVAQAVTGEKDAVLADDDEFNPGGMDPQQLDVSKLIPLIVAALQDVIGRLDKAKAK